MPITLEEKKIRRMSLKDMIIHNRIKNAIVDFASINKIHPDDIEVEILNRCTNISRHSLTKFISNNSQPSLRESWQIASILGCTIDSLIDVK